MRLRSSVALVVCCLLTVFVAVSGATAQGGRTSGAASPQEVIAVIKNATAENDLLGVLPVISPSGLKEIANESVSGLMILLAFSDPNDPMPGGPSKPKAELDAEKQEVHTGGGHREDHAEAVRVGHPRSENRPCRTRSRNRSMRPSPRPTTSR